MSSSSSSSTVVRTDLNAHEDQQLLQTFTIVSRLYWCFNALTQACQTADCLVHIFLSLQSIVCGDCWLLCCASLALNTISVIVKWRVFSFANPFYFLVNHCPSKYSARSRFRLSQLWYRYQDIVNNFFVKARRSSNATKNFGYLNVKILAVVFIEDFGSPKLPCPGFLVHELYESLPFLVSLLLYISYFRVDDPVCTGSILLSLACIVCQVLNVLATLDNIHYSILGGRFWCMTMDIVGSLAMVSCLVLLLVEDADADATSGLQWLRFILQIKFLCMTLPLSFGLSWLFVLRGIGMSYNPHHRPNTVTFLLQLVFTAFLIAVITVLSSIGMEMATFHWIGVLINRLCNMRFSYFDGNNNFWRRIIEWMLTDFGSHVRRKHCHDVALQQRLLHGLQTKERILRLFCVNATLSRYHPFKRFHDVALRQWTNDVYRDVFYTHFSCQGYEITASDFKRHSQLPSQTLFAMMIHEQIAIYFTGSNASTANDLVQYLADALESFNCAPNLVRRQDIDWLCQRMFDVIFYATLWIASPLYLASRAVNVCVPAILWWMMPAIGWRFPWIMTVCYYVSIACFLLAWNVSVDCAGWSVQCGREVSQLIASLCPSLQRPHELYVSLKHGYFTQHELFERILWYYERHRYAQIEGEIVIDRFGPDIAREIFDFLPMSYAEEKISASN